MPSPSMGRLPLPLCHGPTSGGQERLRQPRGAGAQRRAAPRCRTASGTIPRCTRGLGQLPVAAPGPIVMGSEEWGIDFQSEVAVITDDVPMGTSPQSGRQPHQALMLVNDVSLRNLILRRARQRIWLLPVQVLQRLLAGGHHPGRVQRRLARWLKCTAAADPSQRRPVPGAPDARVDMTFNFPNSSPIAAHDPTPGAGMHHRLGTVSNYDRSAWILLPCRAADAGTSSQVKPLHPAPAL